MFQVLMLVSIVPVFVVAERVYSSHRKKELVFKGQSLELELDLPWLTAEHDDHKVRVSGLTNDLDPEKLKFYLSALADNVVTEIYFDQTHSRAVATFLHRVGMHLNARSKN